MSSAVYYRTKMAGEIQKSEGCTNCERAIFGNYMSPPQREWVQKEGKSYFCEVFQRPVHYNEGRTCSSFQMDGCNY